jgi:hypothetical protein
MLRPYPTNDWDSFEELHVIVEQLELCQGLLHSRSHSKARAAVILLDHVADALMYRACNSDFENQAFLEMVIPPALPAKKRANIQFRFDEKVSYLSKRKRHIAADDASVLIIGHRVRNFAYHRNYHNPNTISAVGRILYKTVCAILPILSQQVQHIYSFRTKQQTWTKRYGVTANLFNFEESTRCIADRLAQQVKFSLPSAARVMKADLSARYRTMQRTLKHWLALKSDSRVNDLLRHYEFADVHAEDLLKLIQPLKKARYLVHDLHKGLPPEEWLKVPVQPERRREIRRALIVAERNFKTQRRRLFRSFRQTVTAGSLRAMNQQIRKLTTAPSLSHLLSQYDSLERRLTQAESYVYRAEIDLEFAIDLSRGK